MTDVTPEFPESDAAHLVESLDDALASDPTENEAPAVEESSLGFAAPGSPIFESDSGGGSF